MRGYVLECGCDHYGSVSVHTCAAISGQCECRERFTGRDCSYCEVSVNIRNFFLNKSFRIRLDLQLIYNTFYFVHIKFDESRVI